MLAGTWKKIVDWDLGGLQSKTKAKVNPSQALLRYAANEAVAELNNKSTKSHIKVHNDVTTQMPMQPGNQCQGQ